MATKRKTHWLGRLFRRITRSRRRRHRSSDTGRRLSSETSVTPLNTATTNDLVIPQKPPLHAVLKGITLFFILAIASVAGGVSWWLLEAQELSAFDQMYSTITASLGQEANQALLDRMATVEAADTAFVIPPGGNVSFTANYEDFSRKMLSVGKGSYCAITPIIFQDEKDAFEAFLFENWADQLPAVAHVTNGTELLKTKLQGGMTDGNFKLHRNNTLRSVGFRGSGPESLEVPPPEGFREFYAPETHVAPLATFLLAPGLSNDRNASFRALAQNTVLRTDRSTVTGLIIMAADIVLRGRLRLALVIVSPLHWRDPRTNATNITGFSSATFAWDSALQKTVPAGASLYVVITSPSKELNLRPADLYGDAGADVDTSVFTLKLTRNSSENLGWGDLRPSSAELSRHERRIELNFQGVPFILSVTPAQEFYDAYITDRPRNIGVGAVLLTLVVAVFVLALDAISSRHLKSVIVAAVRQHEAKTERVWAVMNQLAYNSTIASQVSDPAWAIVGGLDVLRSTDLSDLQQRVVDDMSVGASLVLSVIEESLPVNNASAANPKSQVDLRESIFRQSWMTVRLQTRFQDKLRAVSTRLAITDNVPQSASLDIVRTRSVLVNLLSNALLRAAPGSEIKCLGDYSRSSRLLVVTVSFTGEPISDDEYALIFPYSSGLTSGEAVAAYNRAMGKPVLRIAVSHDILSTMGGAFDVERTTDGATFVAKLPLWRERFAADSNTNADGGWRPQSAGGGSSVVLQGGAAAAAAAAAVAAAAAAEGGGAKKGILKYTAAVPPRYDGDGQRSVEPLRRADLPTAAVPKRELDLADDRLPRSPRSCSSSSLLFPVGWTSETHGLPLSDRDDSAAAAGGGPAGAQRGAALQAVPVASNSALSALSGGGSALSETSDTSSAAERAAQLSRSSGAGVPRSPGSRASFSRGDARALRAIVAVKNHLVWRSLRIMLDIYGVVAWESVNNGLFLTSRVNEDPLAFDIIIVDERLQGVREGADGAETLRDLGSFFAKQGVSPPVLCLLADPPAAAAGGEGGSVLPRGVSVEEVVVDGQRAGTDDSSAAAAERGQAPSASPTPQPSQPSVPPATIICQKPITQAALQPVIVRALRRRNKWGLVPLTPDEEGAPGSPGKLSAAYPAFSTEDLSPV